MFQSCVVALELFSKTINFFLKKLFLKMFNEQLPTAHVLLSFD